MNVTQIEQSGELAELLAAPAANRPAESVLDLPHGMHLDVPAERYHARCLGLVSNTAIDIFDHAPLLYRGWVDEPDKRETPALFLGRAFHCYAVEPEVFARLYAVEPDFGYCMKHEPSGTSAERGKQNKLARDAWRAAHAGKAHVSAEDWVTLEGMTRSLRAHKILGPLLELGHSEVTCRWRDPQTGLECKARLDKWIPECKIVLDLKSTEDARRDAFRKSCEVYRYDRQEALYRRGCAAVGVDVEEFVFGAIEKTPPYLCDYYTLKPKSVAEADRENRESMVRLAECLRRNEWPGLDAGTDEQRQLELRAWRLQA